MVKRNRIRMKLAGLSLVAIGVSCIVYSVAFGSGKAVFWPMYIGFTLLVAGLGMLGFNVNGYPF